MSGTETETSAADFFPASFDLGSLARAADGCRGCDLYKGATQTVFGQGDPHGRVMLVGEEPGDAEDTEGAPFVGPSGSLLDDLLEEAGIDRSKTWVTNAVKHFKFERRGTKRIHLKPTMLEIRSCRPWLNAEIELVEPEVMVLLGASASQALLGRQFRISQRRGEWLDWDREPKLLATWHPSAVLRGPEREDRHRKRAEMLDDLKKVAEELK